MCLLQRKFVTALSKRIELNMFRKDLLNSVLFGKTHCSNYTFNDLQPFTHTLISITEHIFANQWWINDFTSSFHYCLMCNTTENDNKSCLIDSQNSNHVRTINCYHYYFDTRYRSVHTKQKTKKICFNVLNQRWINDTPIYLSYPYPYHLIDATYILGLSANKRVSLFFMHVQSF